MQGNEEAFNTFTSIPKISIQNLQPSYLATVLVSHLTGGIVERLFGKGKRTPTGYPPTPVKY